MTLRKKTSHRKQWYSLRKKKQLIENNDTVKQKTSHRKHCYSSRNMPTHRKQWYSKVKTISSKTVIHPRKKHLIWNNDTGKVKNKENISWKSMIQLKEKIPSRLKQWQSLIFKNPAFVWLTWIPLSFAAAEFVEIKLILMQKRDLWRAI